MPIPDTLPRKITADFRAEKKYGGRKIFCDALVNACTSWCNSTGRKSTLHDNVLMQNWNVIQLNLISFLHLVAPAERFLYGCYWDLTPERRVPGATTTGLSWSVDLPLWCCKWLEGPLELVLNGSLLTSVPIKKIPVQWIKSIYPFNGRLPHFL